MLLYANTDLQQLVQQALVTQPPSSLNASRSPSSPIQVKFVAGGAIYDPTAFTASIVSASVTLDPAPMVITTSSPHNITSGATVIVSVTGSAPVINGSYVATVLSPTTFSIPTQITVAGTGGSVTTFNDINLRWTVKDTGQYNQDPPLAFLNSFVKTGSGTSTLFTGLCNYITDELNAVLGVVAPITDTCTISEAAPGVVTTTSAHAFSAGDIVVIVAGDDTTVLPEPLNFGQEYYIASISSPTEFTISETKGGTAITTVTAISGTQPTVIRTVASNALGKYPAICELSWDGITPGKTAPVTLNILNDLYKGTETTPISASITPIGLSSDGNIYLGANLRIVPSDTGGTLQTSPTGTDPWINQAIWP